MTVMEMDTTAAPADGVSDVQTQTDTGQADLGTQDVGALDSGVSQESVDGIFEHEGQQITLEEARNGYLRQADYTRKTQELAEQRAHLNRAEALAAALEHNPQETIRVLAGNLGVELGNAEGNQLDMDELDPTERKLVELEQWKQSQEEVARQAQIDKELDDLHSRFGEFDENELFAYAIRTEAPNLRTAYADLNLDTLWEQATAQQQAQATEAERTDAKRAAQAIHSGVGAAGTEPAPQTFGSFREAYLAAAKEHGALP